MPTSKCSVLHTGLSRLKMNDVPLFHSRSHTVPALPSWLAMMLRLAPSAQS
jgi:hypothetical protein